MPERQGRLARRLMWRCRHHRNPSATQPKHLAPISTGCRGDEKHPPLFRGYVHCALPKKRWKKFTFSPSNRRISNRPSTKLYMTGKRLSVSHGFSQHPSRGPPNISGTCGSVFESHRAVAWEFNAQQNKTSCPHWGDKATKQPQDSPCMTCQSPYLGSPMIPEP